MHSRMWGKVGYMVVKLDMSKAYDRYEKKYCCTWGHIFTSKFCCFASWGNATRLLENYGEKYRNAQSSNTAVSIKWTPPPNGCFKANWDIALNRKTKWMGIGVIIRDDQGLVSSTLCQTKEGFLEPVTAEVMGTLCTIELCKDLGLQMLFWKGMQSRWYRPSINRDAKLLLWTYFGRYSCSSAYI